MILLIICLFIFNFFFTASEMAFITSNKFFILVRSQRQKNYRLLNDLLSKPEIYLYTVLVGTNLTVSLLTLITESIFLKKIEIGESLFFSFLLAFVILIVGEIIPKMITQSNPERFALIYAPAIRVFHILFYPMILISKGFSEIIFKLAKMENKSIKNPVLTKSDLEYFVKGGVNTEKVSSDENKLIAGIFEFNDMIAIDVMVPRTEMVMLDGNHDFDNAKAELLENEKIFTRLPVFSENQDNIIGIVNINNLIMMKKGNVAHIAEEVFFVPEIISLGNLLIDMKQKNKHMAIIVDEYGQVTGLVTLEDIVEELIGDISDEYDKDEGIDIRRGKIIVEGDT
ncbi:DUF21 domain-containing protein, partial [candidate division WOR-3 bacterium]|nr:DUF21 domain-containing protein [candidate division WOR-3 bacterium]